MASWPGAAAVSRSNARSVVPAGFGVQTRKAERFREERVLARDTSGPGREGLSIAQLSLVRRGG
jgi:hypothetical protein